MHSGKNQAHGVRLRQHDFGLGKQKAEGRMKDAEVLALPSTGAPKARKIPGGDPEKSLGIFGLVAHITAFTQ